MINLKKTLLNFRSKIRRFFLVPCLVSAVLSTGSIAPLVLIPTANATVLESTHLMATIKSVKDVDRQAKVALDEVVGAGTSNQIEGQIDKGVGAVQQELGKATGQVQGAMKQAEGKAEQDIGKVQGAIERAGSETEETSENVVDSIKNFFGQ